jgi:hypothetical protein
MVSRMFDAISIFCGVMAGLQRPSPSGAKNRSAATSCDGRSGPLKHSSKLAGRVAAAGGGMNCPRAATQNRLSTNSSSHHALQRSSVRLGTRIHSVSWLTRQSVRPVRTALASTTVTAR